MLCGVYWVVCGTGLSLLGYTARTIESSMDTTLSMCGIKRWYYMHSYICMWLLLMSASLSASASKFPYIYTPSLYNSTQLYSTPSIKNSIIYYSLLLACGHDTTSGSNCRHMYAQYSKVQYSIHTHLLCTITL